MNGGDARGRYPLSARTRVVVIAGMRWSLPRFRWELLEAMVEAGCEVTAMAPNLAGSEVARLLAELGVRSVSFAMQRQGMDPRSDLRTAADLARQLNMVKPDKVLSYSLKAVIYGSVAARIVGVPETYSLITGLGYTFVGDSWRRRPLQEMVVVMSRLALQNNEAVLFQNPDDLALFRGRHIVDGQKTVVVNGSGVNLQAYVQQPVSATTPTFLLMSRLIEAKGIREFAEAAAVLKQRHPCARFQLLGGIEKGPARLPPEQVEAWEREGVLEVLGFMPDVRLALAACSVLVLPSYYREGTPRSVLEALATGRAVVTTDTPGCRETVVDGVNGFLVAPRDVTGLIEAMERFIVEPSLAETMGAASRRLAEDKYDVHAVNRAMLEAMGIH